MVQLSGMSAIDSPSLTGMEKCGEYHCAVDFQLFCLADPSAVPYGSQSAEGIACFGNSAVYFVISCD